MWVWELWRPTVLLSVCFQDVCKIVVNYCHILKERVRVLSENSDHGSAINMVSTLTSRLWDSFVMLQNKRKNVKCLRSLQLCVVVNDLEHLRSVLTRLPTQLNWAGLRDRTQNVIGESQFHNTLPSQLEQSQGILSREIRSALDTLGKKVCPLLCVRAWLKTVLIIKRDGNMVYTLSVCLSSWIQTLRLTSETCQPGEGFLPSPQRMYVNISDH